MKRLSKSILWKVGLGLLPVLLIGVVFAPMAQAQQAENQILKIGLKFSDIKTLNPHRATGSQDRPIAEIVFSGLLRYKPGHLSVDMIEPDLAKTVPVPKILPDGRQQWVFNLRRGVTSHPYDGKPGYELTSEDVIYSLRRAADPKRSAFPGDYASMTFEAVDRYTIKVTLEKPVSSHLFLPKVANRGGGLIVCKKPIEEKGDEWFKTHPVGTGPFIFKSYEPQEKVVLVRNENYFRGVPKLARVEFFYTPEVISRELALRKGELDVIEGPFRQSWGEKLEKIPGIITEFAGSTIAIVAHFNMTVEPLNLLKVRQAIAYALNRREFVALYGERVAEPIYSPVPATRMTGGLTREECAEKNLLYELNLDKAKELLVEAGYPKGFSLKVSTSAMWGYKSLYELMQAQLGKVGINLKLSVVDHSAFHSRIRQDLDPIVIYSCARANPDIILTHFYFSESIVAKGKKPITNFSHIGAVDADGDGKIDSIDDLIEAARTEEDPEKQLELWKEAQRRTLQYMVAYPIMGVGKVFAMKPYVDWGYKLVSIVDALKPTENTQILKKEQ
ncbi:MAG: ABC transporter substrate-binding protein [Pseudomonadota bacterium]